MQALTFTWAMLGAQAYDSAEGYDSAQSEVPYSAKFWRGKY